MTSGRKRPDLKIASDAKQDRADDLLGAVVPSRARDNPAASLPPEADLSNVVTFAPRNRKGEAETPPIAIAAADRPAPLSVHADRQRQIALLIGGSLLIHGAIFAAFNREPEPHASIGMISITAEIVLGAQSNAGTVADAERIRGGDRVIRRQTDQPTDIQAGSRSQGYCQETGRGAERRAEPEKAEAAAPKAEEALPVESCRHRTEQAELVVETKAGRKTEVDATPTRRSRKPRRRKKVREAARHAKDDGDSKRDRAAPASPSVGRLQQHRTRPLRPRHELSRHRRRASCALQADAVERAKPARRAPRPFRSA